MVCEVKQWIKDDAQLPLSNWMVGLIIQRTKDESVLIYSLIQKVLHHSLGVRVLNQNCNTLLSWSLYSNRGRLVNKRRNTIASESDNCYKGMMPLKMFKEYEARDIQISLASHSDFIMQASNWKH